MEANSAIPFLSFRWSLEFHLVWPKNYCGFTFRIEDIYDRAFSHAAGGQRQVDVLFSKFCIHKRKKKQTMNQ